MVFMKSFIIALSCFFMLSAYAEPPNISLVKQEIHTYVDSGTYSRELSVVLKQADNYIVRQAQLNQRYKYPQKLALVLDIDETSLSNYQEIAKLDFTANRNTIRAHILKANAKVIAPTLKLYNDARKQGISVFFVTGRNPSERQATVTNLERAGYKNWTGIYLRPADDKHKSVAYFKTAARAAICKRGYIIIANIGDQYSDLRGGYAKRTFKLPNPFYFLP